MRNLDLQIALGVSKNINDSNLCPPLTIVDTFNNDSEKVKSGSVNTVASSSQLEHDPS